MINIDKKTLIQIGSMHHAALNHWAEHFVCHTNWSYFDTMFFLYVIAKKQVASLEKHFPFAEGTESQAALENEALIISLHQTVQKYYH